MGFAIAKSARDLGANVTLITGPTNLKNIPEVNMHHIKTADEMLKAVNHNLNVDYIIMNAAVADFKVSNISRGKIKKNNEKMNVELSPTIDILQSIQSNTTATVIGFALEMDNERDNALKKMNSKGLDFIILNTANNKDQGFDVDTNQVTIFSKSGSEIQSEIDTKSRIADFIWKNIMD